MIFPTAEEVARELALVNKQVDDECDVRLQVYDTGLWMLRWGSSDYDQDHRGYWGASCVPGWNHQPNAPLSFFTDTANDLTEQVKEDYHTNHTENHTD